MTLVSAAQLAAFAPRADPALAPALDAAASEFGIATPPRLAAWMGQLHHESGGFTRLEENLRYSAQRLTQVWPSRFPSIAAATPFAMNPEALANKVYGGRMGNTQPGDGWRFRGRGLMQTTGRANYAAAATATGLDLLRNPDLLKTPAGAARSAAVFWSDHGLSALADRDDVAGITRVINGGQIGLDDRKAQVARAKTIWR